MDSSWCLSQTSLYYKKNGIYIGKGYASDGMWKLNVMTIIKSNMNKASTPTYLLESSNLWN